MTSLALTPEALLDLRREFDAGFQGVPERPESAHADYLLLTISGTIYAVSLSSIAMLQARNHITPLPNSPHGLLGLSAYRGELLAVYDLALCLGQPPPTSHPWLMRVAGTRSAFAFEHLAQHVRSHDVAQHSHASRKVNLQDAKSVPLIDLPSLLKSVSASSPPHPKQTSKEQ